MADRPDKTFEGMTYRWVDSQKKYLPLERDYEGQTYVLFGDKYLPKLSEEQKVLAKDEPSVFNPQEQTDWRDFTRNWISPLLRGTMVNLGRVGGAAVSAPLAAGGSVAGTPAVGAGILAGGMLSGGMAGDQLYQQLQKINPRIFGVAPSSIQQSVGESALNTGIDFGASKVIDAGLARNKMGTILGKLFPNEPNIPVQDALRQTPNFAIDLAQATQNPQARIIRDVLEGSKTRKEFAAQQPQLRQQAEDLLSQNYGAPVVLENQVAGAGQQIGEQKLLNKALSNKAYAEIYAARSPEHKAEAGTEYMRRILLESMNADGQFTGFGTALKKFNGSQDVASALLNSETKTNFGYLLRRMEAVDPRLIHNYKVAFTVRGINAIVVLGSGVLGYKAGGPLTGAGTFLGTVALSKALTSKLFFNKSAVRTAAKLATMPPSSTEAQILTRQLLKTAFKGAQFETQYGPMIVGPDGRVYPTEVSEPSTQE